MELVGGITIHNSTPPDSKNAIRTINSVKDEKELHKVRSSAGHCKTISPVRLPASVFAPF
jgi:hypothetical protein